MEVDQERVITFPEGLLGFRDFRQYFLHESSPGAALIWMQSVEMPALAFVVIDPRLITADYEVKVSAGLLEELELPDISSAQVWVILTIPEDATKMTANLQGPLVINPDAHLGAQVVLNEDGITTKYPVLEGLRAMGRASKA